MGQLKAPACSECNISFPADHVLLITIARPKKANCYTRQMSWDLDALFRWFDAEPSLRVAVITGAGDKAFCAGSELSEIQDAQKNRHLSKEHALPSSGSGGLSRRRGKKPVIAAVNGLALGGGFEMVLNCDMSYASSKAVFGLPETLVGVYAWGGGLPRLMRAVGLPLASDIAFTGKRISAQEALNLRLINGISKSEDSVLEEALAKAKEVAAISTDSIIVSRAALREAWETASIERAHEIVHERYYDLLMATPNTAEGLASFVEKRKPAWGDPKL